MNFEGARLAEQNLPSTGSKRLLCATVIFVSITAAAQSSGTKSPKGVSAANKTEADWSSYTGSEASTHYSKLDQINTSNVSKLEEVWRFDSKEKGGLETSPVVVHGILYAYTPTQKIFALQAATGKLLWEFDPKQSSTKLQRGLVYWENGSDKRILASVSSYVYALDPATGKPIESFGDHGRIDIRYGLRDDPKTLSVSMSSPGVVYKDLLIVGGGMPEALPAAPGDIRAFDVHTGKMRWTFHTIPHPGEFGYDTWPKDAWTYSGAANNWCGMTVDTERGIVYVPTGSAATDWYGADRLGDDLFANSLIAINAATGKRIWHFQAVHHDLWDRDFPAPPALVTVTRNGKQIPAVAQTSKQGYLYLFNRIDGTPLFPMQNRKYLPSTVPGEVAAVEQTLPTMPAPFARQGVTEADLTDRTPAAHKWAIEHFHQIRSDGQFVPISVDKDTMMMPGFDGGAEWGGPAFDPNTHILYINSNDFALTESLVKHQPGSQGRDIYMSQCAACHGANRQGQPPDIPSLVGVTTRLTYDQVGNTVQMGKGRMPAFPDLANGGAKFDSLRKYLASGDNLEGSAKKPELKTQQSEEKQPEGVISSGENFDFTGYKKFNDPDGYPAVAPPWGTLNAINLDTGEYVWKIPFGQYPELVAKGISDTGSENYGGPIVTAGGVLFIGATVLDKKFRAYDKATGKLLWETILPLSANATPITYEIEGRQYIVIGAGGQRDPSVPSGGVYIAFALPK
jgi:quinoprotein glucose dehydrogenase